jgi:hypothetical protein
MNIALLVLAALLGGPEQVQVIQTVTGPDEARIATYNEAVLDGVRALYPKICPELRGFTLETGAGWVSFPAHAAVYFARLYKGEDRIAWQIPMRGQDPAAAARDIVDNVRLALAAAEHCGSVARLCEAAFTHKDTCRGVSTASKERGRE